MASPFGMIKDKKYMQTALAYAQRAYEEDEVPIGAVIVDASGTIIGHGYNQVEHQCSQTKHAELQAIESAGKKSQSWRLEGCWLYVTLEPCAMCMYAIMLSRLAGVVYGASSKIYGFHLDDTLSLHVYAAGIPLISGVEKEESETLLKHFFQKKRKGSNDENGIGKQSGRNKAGTD